MTDHHDIEETLKRFRHQPDARVKRAAMAAYDASSRGGNRRRGFWRRRVPVYAAAAALVAVMAASFLAGHYSARAGRPAIADSPAPAVDATVTSQDVEWSVAAGDLL